MHTAVTTALSFAILFGAVGYSFAYVSGNPVTVQVEEEPEALGIQGVNVTPGIAQAMNLSETRGVLITDIVTGSPAERAGLRGGNELVAVDGRMIPFGGDIIVAVDGRSISNDVDAKAILAEKNVGDSVRFTVIRDGNTIDVNIPIQARQT